MFEYWLAIRVVIIRVYRIHGDISPANTDDFTTLIAHSVYSPNTTVFLAAIFVLVVTIYLSILIGGRLFNKDDGP